MSEQNPIFGSKLRIKRARRSKTIPHQYQVLWKSKSWNLKASAIWFAVREGLTFKEITKQFGTTEAKVRELYDLKGFIMFFPRLASLSQEEVKEAQGKYIMNPGKFREYYEKLTTVYESS